MYSVLLDLQKEDRVWLQLMRGSLIETVNRKTGYSTFSGQCRQGLQIANIQQATGWAAGWAGISRPTSPGSP